MKKVIDVSKHNENIQWSKVKSAVDGVIIRIGYRGYSKLGKIAKDPMADVNIKGCQAQGIPYGVYFFPCPITTAEAIEEAEWIHSQVKDLDLSFPIYLDSEVAEPKFGSGRADNLSKQDRTNLLLALMNHLKRYGHEVGVYASTAWFNNRLDVSKLPTYCKLWVAQYAGKCTFTARKYSAWQFTSQAICDGIDKRVDMSYYYDKFSTNVTVTTKNPYTEPKRLLCRKTPMQYGNDVKWLQYELIRHGCLPENNAKGKSNIDGWFGDATAIAVHAFQKQAKITVDGKVGAITRKYLKM